MSTSATTSIYPFATHTFHDDKPIFFYHSANIKEGTLTVQVLGPNLTYTFRHDKTLRNSRLSTSVMLKKTVGFVAVAGADPHKGHQIIAWAQSGHGMGEGGDTLIAGNSALSNRLWACRTRNVAEVFGMRSSHPYDKTSSRGEEARGSFYSSHVEAKLGTHAIFTLLRVFNIPHDRTNVTRRTLRMLATKTFSGGRKPVVEIYFSRKACGHCERYLSHLQTVTGVKIKPIWRHRLMRMEFANEAIPKNANDNARGSQAARQPEGDEDDDVRVIEIVEIDGPIEIPDDEAEGQVVVIDDDDEGDEDVVVVDGDEPEEDDVVEVTPERRDIIDISNRLDVVDLTTVTATVQAAPLTPSLTARTRAGTAARLHDVLAGIGATLGQRPYRPRAARVPVIDLALLIRDQRQRKAAAEEAHRRARALVEHQAPPLLTTPSRQRPTLATITPFLQRPRAGLQLNARNGQGLALPTPPSSSSRPATQRARRDRVRSRSSSPTIVPDYWSPRLASEEVRGRGQARQSASLPAFLRSPGESPSRKRHERMRRQRD